MAQQRTEDDVVARVLVEQYKGFASGFTYPLCVAYAIEHLVHHDDNRRGGLSAGDALGAAKIRLAFAQAEVDKLKSFRAKSAEFGLYISELRFGDNKASPQILNFTDNYGEAKKFNPDGSDARALAFIEDGPYLKEFLPWQPT